MQLLKIPITYDKESFGFKSEDRLMLLCARRMDGKWLGPYMFGRACADYVDIETFPAEIPPHGMDAQIPTEWQALFESARIARQAAAARDKSAGGSTAAAK